MVDKNQPAKKLYEDVLKWNDTMECVPTWEELLEVEYIRQRGELNMITENVTQYAFDHGLYNAVCWYERCREHHMHPAKLYEQAIKMHEKDHGPIDSWITEDVRMGYEELELETKGDELRRQLRELERKKKAMRRK